MTPGNTRPTRGSVNQQAENTRDPRRWKALALLCTAFFIVILDSSIVLVALPSIETDLDFSAGDLQWVLSA
jgi:predicted MFS family arabinose efflux permease